MRRRAKYVANRPNRETTRREMAKLGEFVRNTTTLSGIVAAAYSLARATHSTAIYLLTIIVAVTTCAYFLTGTYGGFDWYDDKYFKPYRNEPSFKFLIALLSWFLVSMGVAATLIVSIRDVITHLT